VTVSERDVTIDSPNCAHSHALTEEAAYECYIHMGDCSFYIQFFESYYTVSLAPD